MTVDYWFDYWINNIVGDLAPNTIRNYKERYFFNIQPVIGKLPIADDKPLPCKMVSNWCQANHGKHLKTLKYKDFLKENEVL